MNSSLQTAAPATARRTPVERFRGQSRRRLLRADLLTVLAWASVAGSIALWLADGGAAGFSTLAGSFTAIGIVAGLAGMDLVLLMLLLAARTPLIDGAVGHDRALEFHRKLGKPSLYLLLAHGILIAIGYGMAEGLNPVSELVSLWVLVPDMWLAIVSIGLFIAVVVTSLVAVRRRFPYEYWYAIHLLTYAAVLTAIPHQFSTGALFAEGTWQRWYWLVMIIATGAALVHYRVLEPIVATVRHQLTVSRVVTEGPGVVSIELSGRHLDELAGSGGRFFIWRFLSPGRVVAPASLQSLRGTRAVRYLGPRPAADYCSQPRPGVRAASTVEVRDQGSHRRTVRALQYSGPQPEPRCDDRVRHWNHPHPGTAGGHPL
ncbi:ferric reductase-like transmembrane domain-containing protein [Arthrobacter sp. H16F315]|uniref:ferric reductase-like transmembrane domain-containing protein n=1 Tax=Arthrobacter sp. H16F315 TaxID=2955314 RepID=UPI002096C175|nr:ferric reductase-like transmembrane domain-containing protein [Arthrobacter sp. H16F315]MDD1476307.1 ferric reductase-like transmembrane domain-containing protein [Arthrobacter sp. H16F315]